MKMQHLYIKVQNAISDFWGAGAIKNTWNVAVEQSKSTHGGETASVLLTNVILMKVMEVNEIPRRLRNFMKMK